MSIRHTLRFRVAYFDTDQMGTYANGRVFEWFERGRTALFRAHGMPYREMESRGLLLPLCEAHAEFLGRAQYDDLLEMRVACSRPSRVRLRAEIEVVHADTHESVCCGYTLHALVDRNGRPIRPPAWFDKWLTTAEGRASQADGP